MAAKTKITSIDNSKKSTTTIQPKSKPKPKPINVRKPVSKISANNTSYKDADPKNLSEELQKTQQKILNIEKERLKLSNDISAGLIQDDDTTKKILKKLDQNLKNAKDRLDTEIKIVDILQDQRDAVDKIYDKNLGAKALKNVQHFISNLPGGSYLSKMIGFDAIEARAKEYFMAGIQNRSMALSSLIGPLSKLLVIAGGLFIIYKIWKWFVGMEDAAVKTAKAMDISKKDAFELQGTAHGISKDLGIVGVNISEISETMIDMKKTSGYNLGIMAKQNEAAKSLLKSTALLTSQTGLTTENSYKLFQYSTLTNTNLDNIVNSTYAMADELVSSADMLEAIAGTSKSVLINFAKSPEKLIAATKKAKILGWTLNDVSRAGESLLNIESSLAAEMEASILTGRNINMNRARELALMGKEDQLQTELVKQMGNAESYFKMIPLQRQKMAQAVGISVEQMDELMVRQQELEKLGYSQIKLNEVMGYQGSQREVEVKRLLSLGKTEAADLLKKKYLEADRAATSQKFSDAMTKLTDSLKTTLLPVMQGLATAFGWIADVVKYISGSWMGFVGVLLAGLVVFAGYKLAMLGLAALSTKLAASGGLLGKAFGFGGMGGGAIAKTGGGGIFGSIGKGIASMIEAIGSIPIKAVGIFALVMAILVGVAIGLAYAFTLIADGIATMLPGITDMVVRFGEMPNLFIIAAGIGAIGLAVMAFGAMSTAGAMLGAIGSLFGGDVFNRLKKFSELDGVALKKTAGAILMSSNAIKELTDALINFAKIDTSSFLRFASKSATIAISTRMIEALTPWVKKETDSAMDSTGTKKTTTLTDVVILLKELIEKVSQPAIINIEGKTIKELDHKIEMNRSYRMKVD